MLLLDGEDCPFTEGDSLLQAEDQDVTQVAQKLLILDPDNKIDESTPENAEVDEGL